MPGLPPISSKTRSTLSTAEASLSSERNTVEGTTAGVDVVDHDGKGVGAGSSGRVGTLVGGRVRAGGVGAGVCWIGGPTVGPGVRGSVGTGAVHCREHGNKERAENTRVSHVRSTRKRGGR